MMEPCCAQSTPEEIAEARRKCWHTQCNHRAWLEDFAGWRWCGRHWWFTTRWGGGNVWEKIKLTRLYRA